jgi:hypothetical protein
MIFMKKIGLLSFVMGIGICLLPSCTSNDINPPADCSVEGPSLQLVEVVDADCNQQNGLIKVAATGGSGSYQYKLDDGVFQDAPEFTGLGVGTYLITLKDENTCENTLAVNVLNKDGVNLALTSTDAGCHESEGSITADPDGGEAPFQYKIGSGSFQDNPLFENLSRGNYIVTIKDNTGCEAQQTVKVLSGISYENNIKLIIETSCAINDCHNGNQFPDFRQFNNIQANAAKIKELTGNRTMPEEGSLTQSQIDAIACWVDDGAPAN